MQAKQLSYEQLTRIFNPSFEQISLSKLLESPLHSYILNKGAPVVVYEAGGKTKKAIARQCDKGLLLSFRQPYDSFHFKQKIIIHLNLEWKSYVIQVIIQSAHMGDLYVEESSTRFYPRFSTNIRAIACPLPAHYVANILEGRWYVERQKEKLEKNELQFKDKIIAWNKKNSIENIKIPNQQNIIIKSISQGGFAITRNVMLDQKKLKYFTARFSYLTPRKMRHFEIIAIARSNYVNYGLETVNCSFISPVPAISQHFYVREKKILLELSEKVEIYLNDEIRGHTDKLSIIVPFGEHVITIRTLDGEEFREKINIRYFHDVRDTCFTYELFKKTNIQCVITET